MAHPTAPAVTAPVCRTCGGRKLLHRMEVKKRWFLSWKVQRFWLCRTCNGTGTTRNPTISATGGGEHDRQTSAFRIVRR